MKKKRTISEISNRFSRPYLLSFRKDQERWKTSTIADVFLSCNRVSRYALELDGCFRPSNGIAHEVLDKFRVDHVHPRLRAGLSLIINIVSRVAHPPPLLRLPQHVNPRRTGMYWSIPPFYAVKLFPVVVDEVEIKCVARVLSIRQLSPYRRLFFPAVVLHIGVGSDVKNASVTNVFYFRIRFSQRGRSHQSGKTQRSRESVVHVRDELWDDRVL